jgi:uncharacterized protein YjbI with pentapeptide repeats
MDDYTGQKLLEYDIYEGDLDRRELHAPDLSIVNLAGCDLRGATFGNEHYRSNFTSADLRGAYYYPVEDSTL